MKKPRNPGGDSEPKGRLGPPGLARTLEEDVALEVRFNVESIQAVKQMAETIREGQYSPSPEFCARLAELNGVCARFFRPPAPEPEDGGEPRAVYA